MIITDKSSYQWKSSSGQKNVSYENEITQGNMFEIDYVMRWNILKEANCVLRFIILNIIVIHTHVRPLLDVTGKELMA